jgi:hypothetical protein
VAFQTVVVLVGGNENERARDVKEEQPAEQRVEAANLSECVGHGLSMFGTKPSSVNP